MLIKHRFVDEKQKNYVDCIFVQKFKSTMQKFNNINLLDITQN